jgi:hypothetical protein
MSSLLLWPTVLYQVVLVRPRFSSHGELRKP